MSARAVAVIRPAPLIIALQLFLCILSGKRQLHASQYQISVEKIRRFSLQKPLILGSTMRYAATAISGEPGLQAELNDETVLAGLSSRRSTSFDLRIMHARSKRVYTWRV